MFIGHFAVAFAAKKLAPKPSLGTHFIAVQFADLLWPPLLLLGMEKVAIEPGNTAFTPLNFISYPISHSLMMSIVWSLLFAGVYYLIKKDMKGAAVLGLAVLSHWILDVFTHRPDMPLTPGETSYLGLGLWNSIAATIIVEGLLFFGSVTLYSRITKAMNKKGTLVLWSLVAFLALIYVMNIVGPPPPDSTSIAYAGLSMWLLVAWGYWVERNRKII